MAQDNRGYYPTDSLNQEQTEFYNEYPPYQYNNDTNHYHDEGLFELFTFDYRASELISLSPSRFRPGC
jgi:hypothetical protein